jgi:hypothetical protein
VENVPPLDIQPEKLTGTSWADDAADDMFNTCLACSVGEYIKAPHVLSCLVLPDNLVLDMGCILDPTWTAENTVVDSSVERVLSSSSGTSRPNIRHD